jgi:hypothetical protein
MKGNSSNLSARIILVPLCLLFIASLVFSADTGSLRVRVSDLEGTPIPGVEVTISSPNMMSTKSLKSDEKGQVLFVRLFPAVYEVKTKLEGFQTVISQNVRVGLDEETTVRVKMKMVPLEESMTVTAEYPPVDTRNVTVADHITHDIVEELPVSRDFVGYIQLAAGVDMVPNSEGRDTPDDPAGKGGLNYYAREGRPGNRDNVYLLDGVNITGMATQRSIMRFNNEVIQEQLVMTSGIPAEYGGGKSVVTNIITKSGGNRFSGSANIYVQRKNFSWPYKGIAAKQTSLQAYKDNKYDTAFTLGGPIMEDKLWFFLSGQYRIDGDKFNLSQSASSTQELVTYSQKRYNGFGKTSFNLSPKDTISISYFLDYFNIHGSRSKNTILSRQPLSEHHFMAYNAYYQRVFSKNTIVDFRYGHYEYRNANKPLYPEAGVFDDIQIVPGTHYSIEELHYGTLASERADKNTRDQFSASLEWYKGDMRIKAGVMYINENDLDDSFMPFGEQRYSLAPDLSGWSLYDLMRNSVWPQSEFLYNLLPYMNSNWDATADYYDTNGDGVLSRSELRSATFTEMNENGVNFWRWEEIQSGANKVKAKRWIGYLQDDWKISKFFTLSAGLRLENHNYRDSEGGEILNTKAIFLPRIGIAWDIGARGNQKLTFFYGHYSDPMDFNSIHFAGNISGAIQAKQLWLADDWYTYRIYGSSEHRDAVFVPNMKDPVSKEFSLTHEIYLGSGLMLRSQAYIRQDRNIVEDMDVAVYTDTIVGDPIWGDLALSWEDFGYPASGPPEGANFFMANLPAAKRNFYGLDFQFSKRFAKGGRVVFQYSYKSARGNTTSDKDALYQGDMVELDPRNDWMWGSIPGTIPHRIKIYGNFRLPFGITVGGSFNWNSGFVFTESYRRKDTYINWPLNDEWTEFTQTGAEIGPSWCQLNLKIRYMIRFARRTRFEVFLDIYNLLDNQNGWTVQYAHNVSWPYGEVNRVLNPRRLYLGTRFRF